MYALSASPLENTLPDTCPEQSCLLLRCFFDLINPGDQLRELASCVVFENFEETFGTLYAHTAEPFGTFRTGSLARLSNSSV